MGRVGNHGWKNRERLAATEGNYIEEEGEGLHNQRSHLIFVMPVPSLVIDTYLYRLVCHL